MTTQQDPYQAAAEEILMRFGEYVPGESPQITIDIAANIIRRHVPDIGAMMRDERWRQGWAIKNYGASMFIVFDSVAGGDVATGPTPAAAIQAAREGE